MLLNALAATVYYVNVLLIVSLQAVSAKHCRDCPASGLLCIKIILGVDEAFSCAGNHASANTTAWSFRPQSIPRIRHSQSSTDTRKTVCLMHISAESFTLLKAWRVSGIGESQGSGGTWLGPQEVRGHLPLSSKQTCR